MYGLLLLNSFERMAMSADGFLTVAPCGNDKAVTRANDHKPIQPGGDVPKHLLSSDGWTQQTFNSIKQPPARLIEGGRAISAHKMAQGHAWVFGYQVKPARTKP